MLASVQGQTGTTLGDGNGIDSLIVSIRKVSGIIPTIVGIVQSCEPRGKDFTRKPTAKVLIHELAHDNADFNATLVLLEQQKTDRPAEHERFWKALIEVLFSNYDKAMTLLNENMSAHLFHHILKERLGKELQSNARENILSQLEKERKVYRETQLELEKERNLHRDLISHLESEHQTTKSQLNEEQKAHEKTRSKYLETQSKLEEQTNSHHSTMAMLAEERRAHLNTRQLLDEAQTNHRTTEAALEEAKRQMAEIQQSCEANKLQIEHEWRIKEETLHNFVKNLCNVPMPPSFHYRHEATEGATKVTPGSCRALRRSQSTREISVLQQRIVRRESGSQLLELRAVDKQQEFSHTQQQAVMARSPIDPPLAVEIPTQAAHRHHHHHHQTLLGSPTGCPTGPLEPAQYNAIMKNIRDLVRNMPAKQVLDFLISARVINPEQWDDISSLSTSDEMAREILKLVLRHPEGYSVLINALESPDCGPAWLARRLCNDVEEFERMHTETQA